MAKKNGEFTPEWIEGLKVRGSETRTVEEEGKPVKKTFPIERPMKEEDVLDWKETDTEVILVACDGRKHRIAKGASKGERKDGGKGKDK